MTRPKKLLYLAIDGHIKPMAKGMGRTKIPFNSFMVNLESRLEKMIVKNISEDKRWQKMQVVLSGYKVYL